MGSRNSACPNTRLLVSLFWWRRRFSVQYQPQRIHLCDLVDRDFLDDLWVDHIDARFSARQPVLYASFVDSLVTSYLYGVRTLHGFRHHFWSFG